MTVAEAISKVTAVITAELGYLEKRTNAQLDSKTANAGSNNYTKYWRDLAKWGLGNFQAQYWCAATIHWIFVIAFGLAAASKLLLHAPYISCQTLATKAKAAGRLFTSPKVGDVVVFFNGTRMSHTAWIYKVTSTHYYTMEGNTDGASGVIRNGGGVCSKSYSITASQRKGDKFFRPDYAKVLGATQNSTPAPAPKPSTAKPAAVTTHSKTENIKTAQKWLNTNYEKQIKKYCGKLLVVDGDYGPASRAAALCVWKELQNRKYGTKLTPNNTAFGSACEMAVKNAIVKVNSAGTFTYIAQLILSSRGYYGGAMDAACGAALVTAIREFQKAHKLTQDGVIGIKTWYKLFN